MITARLFACCLLLSTVPALAQAIDTHVDDVSETPDGFRCRSRAYPELRIAHDWRDGDRAASWSFASRDAATGRDKLLRVTFRPDVDAPFGVETLAMGFTLDFDRAPLAGIPRTAHLRLDGKPDAVALDVSGSKTDASIAVVERQRPELADRLMHAALAELDLTDATGTPLGRYAWDVRALRHAPEVLQLINWSCR